MHRNTGPCHNENKSVIMGALWCMGSINAISHIYSNEIFFLFHSCSYGAENSLVLSQGAIEPCRTPANQSQPAALEWETNSEPVINTLRLRQNGRHFTDDIFKCIFLNENAWILISISLKFVPKGPINNIPALVQIMAWHQTGDKPLSETMMS